MAESIIKNPHAINTINIDDCSTVHQIFNRLRKTGAIGIGSVGNLANTAIKDLLDNPAIGNFATVSVKIVCDVTGYIIMEVLAVNNANVNCDMSRKYLWINGSSEIEGQSAWERISRKS